VPHVRSSCEPVPEVIPIGKRPNRNIKDSEKALKAFVYFFLRGLRALRDLEVLISSVTVEARFIEACVNFRVRN
jgi:hypothetical protein